MEHELQDERTCKDFVSPTAIRDRFSRAMSDIYKSEVPLYSVLLSLVTEVNGSVLAEDHTLYRQLSATDEIQRLNIERHGAIRLGTPQELGTMRRFLKIMDMEPVGYYDLSGAGLPVHATCFRPIHQASLAQNPFRLFTSLVRLDMISEHLREWVGKLLSRRQIFNPRVLELLDECEQNGGLTESQAEEYIQNGLETFKWRSASTVTHEEYKTLQRESPLLADIAAFPGPHINHLTPRTLDIDAAQLRMLRAGIPAKEGVEGPPKRKNPVLLRQTSFTAVEEKVYFAMSTEELQSHVLGSHAARFGEIEQRGAALTPKGRALYDRLIRTAEQRGITICDVDAWADIFSEFPDDPVVMHDEKLAWYRYFVAEGDHDGIDPGAKVQDLLFQGRITYEPIVYEDFLPFSAAGIFQSNLQRTKASIAASDDSEALGLASFEKALGVKYLDEMELYRNLEQASLKLVRKELGLTS